MLFQLLNLIAASDFFQDASIETPDISLDETDPSSVDEVFALAKDSSYSRPVSFNLAPRSVKRQARRVLPDLNRAVDLSDSEKSGQGIHLFISSKKETMSNTKLSEKLGHPVFSIRHYKDFCQKYILVDKYHKQLMNETDKTKARIVGLYKDTLIDVINAVDEAFGKYEHEEIETVNNEIIFKLPANFNVDSFNVLLKNCADFENSFIFRKFFRISDE